MFARSRIADQLRLRLRLFQTISYECADHQFAIGTIHAFLKIEVEELDRVTFEDALAGLVVVAAH